ncbi:hypothetical protein LEP1GSC161_1506 [Leptospira santarosai str. CBC1416]|uniref:Uncharacterized protein n=1 Tax=Leptospira santarosai str. CBC1416 TaxID=1193059 RepID=M6VZ09_9LEPT|nr:hypothetical protein LEP1GSC161_1506 [Leptospira santarosai str. CBC1416]
MSSRIFSGFYQVLNTGLYSNLLIDYLRSNEVSINASTSKKTGPFLTVFSSL